MKNVNYFDEYSDYNKFKSLVLKILKKDRFKVYSNLITFFNNKTISSFNNVATYLKEQRFDYIHAGLGNRPATVAMLLSDISGIPFTFECHAYDLFVDFPFAKEKIEKAKKIFTISEYNKKYLIDEFDCADCKIVVKRVAFNKSFCDKIRNINKDDNIIVSICRLHEIKGLEYSLKAISILIKKRKNIKYLIIGDGPQKNFLKKKIKSLEISKNVFLLGDIPNEEALTYIKKAKISLLTSVIAKNGDRDGIPTFLIESMYLGTLVVASNISGIPELIEDGVSGFLTRPKDVLNIVDKIDALLENEKLQIQFIQNAKNKIIKKFNIESNMGKMTNVFEN